MQNLWRQIRQSIQDSLDEPIVRRSILNVVIVILFGLLAFLLAYFVYYVYPDFLQALFGFSDRFGSASLYRIIFYIISAVIFGVFYFGLRPLLSESGYENVKSRSRDTEVLMAEIRRLRREFYRVRGGIKRPLSKSLEQTTQQIEKKIESRILKSIDLTNPDKLFQASRERLLEDSARLDKISRRNLYFGIVFSAFALGFLAWPLVAQTLNLPLVGVTSVPKENATNNEIFRWVAQSYLPRFAVGLLLQFVGFFFLRLYVANETDLKHNKNEITNIESKMMAVQLAGKWANAAAKKDLLKFLGSTERNFILKKNERMMSSDTVTEYNDLKSTIDKLITKLPTGR